MKNNKRVLGIIPARYHSTRFEGKPLAKILGEPMIKYVYRNIQNCDLFDEIVVATDDQRIMDCVNAFGGKAVLTSREHPTGTDRVAEAAQQFDADIVVNIQGDEPMVNHQMMRDIIEPMLDDPSLLVANLVSRIKDLGDYIDTTVVKTAIDKNNNLMYLTRSPIPYPKTRQKYVVYKQIGIYSFRKDFLLKYVNMEQTDLELIEGIEFLRILENGIKIRAAFTDYSPISVDTLSDLKEVEGILIKQKQKLEVS